MKRKRISFLTMLMLAFILLMPASFRQLLNQEQ